MGGTGSAEYWGPAQRHREELRAESPWDRGLGRKGHLPSPEFLTGNKLAGPCGLGTVCFPWATVLLVSHICYKARGLPRGKHQDSDSVRNHSQSYLLLWALSTLSPAQRGPVELSGQPACGIAPALPPSPVAVVRSNANQEFLINEAPTNESFLLTEKMSQRF